MSVMTTCFDVVCLGEVLLEVATQAPFGHDVPAVLGISGDALNVAAAAAAAGARVGLIAVLTDDELGRAITARVAQLGISTELLQYAPGQQACTWCTATRQGSGSSPTPGRAVSAHRCDGITFR
jgi:sugar/nucleoside kinase (ribokinase family)